MLKTSFSSIVSQLHVMLKTGKSCVCERSSLARLAPCTAALFTASSGLLDLWGPLALKRLGPWLHQVPRFLPLGVSMMFNLVATFALSSISSECASPGCWACSAPCRWGTLDHGLRLESVELLTHTRPCMCLCSVSLSSCHQQSMNSGARRHVQ